MIEVANSRQAEEQGEEGSNNSLKSVKRKSDETGH